MLHLLLLIGDISTVVANPHPAALSDLQVPYSQGDYIDQISGESDTEAENLPSYEYPSLTTEDDVALAPPGDYNQLYSSFGTTDNPPDVTSPKSTAPDQDQLVSYEFYNDWMTIEQRDYTNFKCGGQLSLCCIDYHIGSFYSKLACKKSTWFSDVTLLIANMSG